MAISSTHGSQSPKIAIVGGGIAGLTLAISLLNRGIHPTIYEQAQKFGEIGAGVAFSPNAVRAMMACDKGIYEAFKKVATHNQWNDKQKVYFDFMDGYHHHEGDEAKATGGEKLLFTMSNAEGANSVHRAHFLDEMVKLVPEGVAEFSKRLREISGNESDGPLTLHFEDGTTATADAVIGTDGIKSRVRQVILGKDNPASYARYTHKYAYRGLISMEQAIEALGEDMAVNAKMHLGPDHHVLTFPINGGKIMNVVAFTTSKDDWPNSDKLTLPTTKEQALKDYAGWGKHVTSILEMLKDDLDSWAIFDMMDHPASTYAKGRICISGDAAHATSPHHGSGAGFAVEDSAVLAELLASPEAETLRGLEAAFQVFDQTRRPRTQWLVESSRRTGDLFEWRAEGVGSDVKKIEQELYERHQVIWQGDIYQMIHESKSMLQHLLAKE